MFRKLKRYFKDPYYEIGRDLFAKHPNWMSDKWWTSIVWKEEMGYELDWKHPRTFNEKLQWLKIYDHNPLYTTLVDKIAVKEWVAKRIGDEHIIPTLAVWKRAEDIDITSLPEKFVLKCNHDSESVVICRDKSSFDLDSAKQKLASALKYNFYYRQREWPYKHVKPMVFAEQYLETTTGTPEDYKVFNFDGEPKIVEVDYDRFKNHRRNLYDAKTWEYIDASIQYPNAPSLVGEKPDGLDELVGLAGKLSQNMPHVRTDFYLIGKKVYFGEFTFYHGGGYEKFSPEDFGLKMGEWLRISSNSWRGGYSQISKHK